jgi:hypothetical protein
MSTVQEYRSKSDEYARMAAGTRSLKEGSGYRKLARAYKALAESENRPDGKTDLAQPD